MTQDDQEKSDTKASAGGKSPDRREHAAPHRPSEGVPPRRPAPGQTGTNSRHATPASSAQPDLLSRNVSDFLPSRARILQGLVVAVVLFGSCLGFALHVHHKIESDVARARHALEEGRHDEAAHLAQELLNVHPYVAEAKVVLTAARIEQAKARGLATKVRGLAALERGDHAAAYVALKPLVSQRPQDQELADAYAQAREGVARDARRRGDELVKRGALAEAVAAYEEAQARAPDPEVAKILAVLEREAVKRAAALAGRLGGTLQSFVDRYGRAEHDGFLFTQVGAQVNGTFVGKLRQATILYVRLDRRADVSRSCAGYVARFLPEDAERVGTSTDPIEGGLVEIFRSSTLARALPDPRNYGESPVGTFTVYPFDGRGETVILACGDPP
ncbi:MAG: hypothetical protein JKY65_27925 [Planctomycetes bacterium]|nr:hypothetical protein [Planctomycetota bacterium]